MRNTHTLAYAIIYYVAKIRCVSAPRTRRKKRKSTTSVVSLSSGAPVRESASSFEVSRRETTRR